MAVYPFPSNDVAATNVYPTYGTGDSLGIGSTAPYSPVGTDQTPVDNNKNAIERAAAIGAMGQPVRWWLALAVLLVALMYVSQKFGGDESYANLRLSAYNIFTVSLASIIGISLFKVALTKYPVPGLSAVVMTV